MRRWESCRASWFSVAVDSDSWNVPASSGTGTAALAETVAFPPRPNEGTRQYITYLIYYLHDCLLNRLAFTDPHAYPGTSQKDSIIYIGV